MRLIKYITVGLNYGFGKRIKFATINKENLLFYFTMVVSAMALIFDFCIIKHFINILKIM